tara:strand:+ start:799 stop:1536 length:738 start_codon:yes stop_codon:yes gene_type:complete
MSKNFLKKDNVIITSKRTFYLKLACILLIVFLSSIIFSMYTNSYILKSHKESYIANAELNNKINSLRDEIIRNKDYIKKLEASNKEINNVFSKYTDAIKYKIATAEEIKTELFKKEERILELSREINYYKFLSNSKNVNDLISVENFLIEISNTNNSLEYSFLVLSNKSNMNIQAKYNMYFYDKKKVSNNKKHTINLNIEDNKINFKNFLMVSGKSKINKNYTFNTIYLDIIYKDKIYNFEFTIN